MPIRGADILTLMRTSVNCKLRCSLDLCCLSSSLTALILCTIHELAGWDDQVMLSENMGVF